MNQNDVGNKVWDQMRRGNENEGQEMENETRNVMCIGVLHDENQQ